MYFSEHRKVLENNNKNKKISKACKAYNRSMSKHPKVRTQSPDVSQFIFCNHLYEMLFLKPHHT